MSSRGKKYKQMLSAIKKELYSLEEAVEFLKKNVFTKFDETIDLALKLGVDPKHADQMVRGVVELPNGTGKKVRVAVFAKNEKLEEAKNAGADIYGADDLVANIKNGIIDFDKCIATPDMMVALSSVAKILGPKGLMPNPKLGTVTFDIAKAVELIKKGQIEYRVDKAGIIHAGIGKASFSSAAIIENTKSLMQAILKSKPTGSKGTYLESLYLSSTMSPSLKINLNDFVS